MNTIPKQILSFYVLLLALGSTLSGLVYFNGNVISNTTAALIEVDLPLRYNVSQLRFAIFAQKPILFEYYANTDKQTYLKRFSENQKIIKDGLYKIPRDDQSQSFLTQLEFQTGQIAHHAEELDKVLSASNIDWDKAREILVQVSATEALVTPLIDTFISLNIKHVADIGTLAKSRMQLIIQLVIGFSLIILIFAVLLGNKVNAYIAKK